MKKAESSLQRRADYISLTPHQIYTPLTAIKGYVSLIQDGSYGTVPKEMRKALEIIEDSTVKLIETIKSTIHSPHIN
jgi:two-component system NtrC family sensor kinase